MNYDVTFSWAVLLIAAAVWELVWKALALWKASRRGQVGWFIALLVINSVGIVPIFYLLTYREHTKKKEEISHETTIPVHG